MRTSRSRENTEGRPDASWRSSFAVWVGPFWNIVVDLWTKESGRNDMILSARVSEVDDGYRRLVATT